LAARRIQGFFPLETGIYSPRGLFLSNKALAPTEQAGGRPSKELLYICILTPTHTPRKGSRFSGKRKRSHQKCKVKETTEEQQQDINMQPLFPTPSRVQKPPTI